MSDEAAMETAGGGEKSYGSRESAAHMQFNMVSLPVMGTLSLLGLFGGVNPMLTVVTITAYTICDFIWIALKPSTVPTLPWAILLHHAATLGLLVFPLMQPRLANLTCWLGLAELNTLILVFRRMVGMEQPLLKVLYWLTFFPLRLVVYPWMLYLVTLEMKAFPFWQGAIAFACQSVLVIFQIGVVVLAVMEVQRKKAGRPPPKRGVGAPVALLGRARQRPAPPAVQRMACGRSALLGKASMSPVEDLGRAARTSDRPAAAVGMLGPVCQQRDSSRPVLLAGRWRGSLNKGRAVHQAWLSELGARPAVRIM